MIYQRWFGQSRRIVHFSHVAMLVKHPIGYIGHGCDYIHVKFATEAFLYDLHVKQTEESATESESERRRRFRLECQRCIIELQFFERCTEILEILCLYRIYSGKHHRFDLFESSYSLAARTVDMSDRIAHFHLARGLDT